MRASRQLRLFTMLVAALVVAAAPAIAEQGTTEKAFVSAGRVRMDLSAGDYTIKAGRGDRILVTWETEPDPDDRARIDIRTDLANKTAKVTTDGPHNNFKVVIEVPPATDLHIDLSAGNMRVVGITGSKDVGSWAGNVDIEVAKPDDYGRVDCAVKAGDIRAEPFNVKKSGLFRSFSYKGRGRHTLRVRLTAGNLTLIK